MPQLSLILVALALTQTPNITSCEKGECGPGFEKCLLPGPVFTVPMIHLKLPTVWLDLMVTPNENENENENHFGNFLLKNKTKSVLVLRTENQNEFRFRFGFGFG